MLCVYTNKLLGPAMFARSKRECSTEAGGGRQKSFHVCRFVFFIAVLFRVWEVKLKLSREQFSEGFYVMCVMLLLHEYHVVRWIIPFYASLLAVKLKWKSDKVSACFSQPQPADTAVRIFSYCSTQYAHRSICQTSTSFTLCGPTKVYSQVIQFSHLKRAKKASKIAETEKNFLISSIELSSPPPLLHTR